MKTPGELTREQLEDIVGRIQSILWMDVRTGGFDPDRSWDVETIEWVSAAMEDAGLKPGTVTPATEATLDHPGDAGQPEGHGSQGKPSGTAALSGLLAACQAVLRLDDSNADYTFQLPDDLRRQIEQAIADARRGDPIAPNPVRAALDGFIETIEAAGGCSCEDGRLVPVGDPDWIELADAYKQACAAIGRTPMIEPADDEDEEDQPSTPPPG